MKELEMAELENINGGVNWWGVAEGGLEDVGVIAGALAAPEAVIPAIIGAGVASLTIGSSI